MESLIQTVFFVNGSFPPESPTIPLLLVNLGCFPDLPSIPTRNPQVRCSPERNGIDGVEYDLAPGVDRNVRLNLSRACHLPWQEMNVLSEVAPFSR